MGIRTITTKESFDSELRGGGERFALFYSSWCPFCTAFMPAFDAQAAGGASFIKVCTDDLPELEDLFSVEVVPTVLLFRGGKLQARLDGALGRGLGGESLRAFVEKHAARGGRP